MKSTVSKLVKAYWTSELVSGAVVGGKDKKFVTITFDYIETVNKLLVETNEIITDICTVSGSVNWDVNNVGSYTVTGFIWSLVCMRNGKVDRMFNHESAVKMLTEEYVDSRVGKATDYIIDIKGSIQGLDEYMIGLFENSFSY